MKEEALIESRSLRDDFCKQENTEILGKVGTLMVLPSSGFATTKQVANFYQVSLKAIQTIVVRHREELECDGYKVFTRIEFRDLHPEGLKSKARSIAIFPRKAILRTGMLLAESNVAKLVRHYLLATEEQTRLATVHRQALMQMAEQLGNQARELAYNSNLLEKHSLQIEESSTQLKSNATQLRRISEQSNKNASQLICQADMIKAMVREIYFRGTY